MQRWGETLIQAIMQSPLLSETGNTESEREGDMIITHCMIDFIVQAAAPSQKHDRPAVLPIPLPCCLNLSLNPAATCMLQLYGFMPEAGQTLN